MKKLMVLLILVITLLFTSSTSIFAQGRDVETIEGGILIDNRTIFESLDAKVQWEAATKSITVTKESVLIQLQVNSQVATVNGNTTELDVPPKIVDERTLVPVRFVAEALNATVDWDAENAIATIDTLEKIIHVNVQRQAVDFRKYQGTWKISADNVNGNFVNIDFETENKAEVWVATSSGSASVDYMNYREANTEEHTVTFEHLGEASFNFKDTYYGRSGTAHIKLSDNKVTVTITFKEKWDYWFLFEGTRVFSQKR